MKKTLIFLFIASLCSCQQIKTQKLNNELSKSIKNTIQEVFGDEAQLRNLVLENKEGHQYNGIMEIYYKDEITKYNIIVTDDENTCTWEITNILENNKP